MDAVFKHVQAESKEAAGRKALKWMANPDMWIFFRADVERKETRLRPGDPAYIASIDG
jgi:hypothetical protein